MPTNTPGERVLVGCGVKQALLVGVIEALSRPSYPVQRLLKLAADWSEQTRPATKPVRAPRTARLLDAIEVDELVAGFHGGASVARLARLFGIHRGTVSKHLRARGIDPSPKGLSLDDVPAALQLYREGWTYGQIAEKFGVGETTVRDRLHQAGVPKVDRYGRRGRNMARLAARSARAANPPSTFEQE
jgi:transposase-like protein